jgi:putative transposase
MQRAIQEHGAPEIFNTDQGCQFTSAEFTQPLAAARSGRKALNGRQGPLPRQRLRRTALAHRQTRRDLPEELPVSNRDTHTHLENFFHFYNEHRPHSAFGRADPMTPMQVYRRDHHHASSS